MKNELIKERKLNHQLHQHIAMINVNIQQFPPQTSSSHQTSNIIEKTSGHHCVAEDLDPVNREKLAKMASRSISNVSRRASIVDLSKDNVPRVLKSLGWCTVTTKCV